MRDNPSFDLADQLAPVRPSATAWPSQAVLKDSCWCGTVQLLHCGWNFLHMHIRFDGACDPFAWCGGICQYSCACLAQSDCTGFYSSRTATVTFLQSDPCRPMYRRYNSKQRLSLYVTVIRVTTQQQARARRAAQHSRCWLLHNLQAPMG